MFRSLIHRIIVQSIFVASQHCLVAFGDKETEYLKTEALKCFLKHLFCIVGGFKTKDKVKLAKELAERQIKALQVPDEVEIKHTTIQFGLATHNVFRTMCLFLQVNYYSFVFFFNLVCSFFFN